ncbi:MAG: hypothetical protein Q9187_000425 [Circinaria calcarea]
MSDLLTHSIEGELVDLIDEFSDGRVQFAFLKIKDSNTSLPKSVLIGWCGEGVPERTKGYFTSHLAAVAKVLHGYHVQITARSDRDLTPESIIQKISDASSAKYSAASSTDNTAAPSAPPLTKPVFMPTRNTGGAGGFNPLAGSQRRTGSQGNQNVDEDGWGDDAPPVTRTQLEKVQSSYQPTKVNMREISSQGQEPMRFNGTSKGDSNERSDIVKGGYQPVGKVDIAALRRQAQSSNSTTDDRPSIVKGSYEPVGKVDIAAIRAKAQGSSDGAASPQPSISPAVTDTSVRTSKPGDEQRSVLDRSTPFTTSERLTSLPKPKVANRFGLSASNFTGTKAPAPGGYGYESKVSPSGPPVGVGRTFADEGGKTPAQIWAEKKARERGISGTGDKSPSTGVGAPVSPLTSQTSGEWKSGYAGRSWAPVTTTKTGQSSNSLEHQRTGQDGQHSDEGPQSPVGGVGVLRDRFKNAPPMGAATTGSERSVPSSAPLDTSTKSDVIRGIPIPGLPTRPAQGTREAPRMPSPPPQPPRSPTPPTPPAMDSGSPIRVAIPVARGQEPEIEDARQEQFSPPPVMPTRSLEQAVPHEDELEDEPSGPDPARATATAVAANSFGQQATESAQPGAHTSGKRALVQYDYEKAEDNELELKEGEYVINIEMVDEDWWMGQNPHGETGLFPSNYVELVEDDASRGHEHVPEQPLHHESTAESAPPAGPVPSMLEAGHDSSHGAVATALYDYEAAEDNELSFPDGAKITGVVSSRTFPNFAPCYHPLTRA